MIKIKPQQKILAAFLILILIGSIILILPFSTNGNVSYLNMLFTSVSAVTITGLEPVVVSLTFTTFGKIVIACLIQLGGLSITTLQVFLLTIIGAKIGYRDRDLVKENINANHKDGILKMIKRIVFITFIIESFGIIMLFPFFIIKGYSFGQSLGYSIFHTISSYNNAGFSVFNSNSLMIFSEDIYFNIVTIILIVLGGIGSLVIYDLSKNRRWKKLNFHTKIVLKMTSILFVTSSVLFFLLEDNASVINSFFHAATIRTAGFYSYNYQNAKTITLFLTIIFMFIGGAPASTAGGIKITTIFTLFKATKGKLTNSTPLYNKRKIPQDYISKAYLVLVLGIVVTMLSTALILLFDNKDFISVLFEVFSAFSNTGLSLGITSNLTVMSKIVLMILMLIGRVGIVTFFGALTISEVKFENIKYIDIEYLI